MPGWLLSLAGALVLLGFARLIPARAGTEETLSPRTQLTILLRPAVSAGLAANMVLMLGSMMLLTYLAPFVEALASAGTTSRGMLFGISGVAGMVGIWAGGLATDRWGADRALLVGGPGSSCPWWC